MTTKHFNQLTESEQERLVILAEECAEVQQVICKILRHGLESRNPKISNSETNREALQRELGDLLHAYTRCTDAGDLNGAEVEERRISKPGRILPYLHHQAGQRLEAASDEAR